MNIFCQQFSLQITRTLSIEFVELLHWLLYKQIDFVLARVCDVIDHRRRHSVKRTKSHGTRLRLVPYVFDLPRYDVIFDLLQYTCTQNEICFLNINRPLFVILQILFSYPLWSGLICKTEGIKHVFPYFFRFEIEYSYKMHTRNLPTS